MTPQPKNLFYRRLLTLISNHMEITHVIEKCQTLTSLSKILIWYLIQLYLLKSFSENFQAFITNILV